MKRDLLPKTMKRWLMGDLLLTPDIFSQGEKADNKPTVKQHGTPADASLGRMKANIQGQRWEE
jgi:hypothetical protein